MANLALAVADRVYVVESLEQATAPAAEAITAGMAVRFDTTTGKFTKANATSAAEARAYGVATRTVAAGNAVTAIRRGVLDGFDLSGMDYGESVFLSDTDGRVADVTPGTLDVAIGIVIPGFASPIGTAADKLLHVDFAGAAGGAGAGAPGGVTQIEVSYRMLANASLADEAFFIANRAYYVDEIRQVHATAGTDAGAVAVQVTKDTGTAAPGAGTDLLTAGFNLKGTANTVQTGALTSVEADRTLAEGDRLSVDFAGVLTAVTGVVVTVALTPQ